jgi:SAM-dependent methyltransferase
MGFDVAADAYDRFMGRYSNPLAPLLADVAGVAPGERVLDVGCGPGALTTELVRRLGAGSVSAVDPSESFVEAARARHPGVDVRLAPAEQLPFSDAAFNATLAQLVVHFMTDPVAGLAEMARVTRSGGTVAACVWDHAGGTGPISLLWDAVHELDPKARDESHLAGAGQGQLTELFESAGLTQVEESSLTVQVAHPTFEDWWEPYTFGVGPAGAYVAGLDPEQRERLEGLLRERLPEPPFTLAASAWTAVGVRP